MRGAAALTRAKLALAPQSSLWGIAERIVQRASSAVITVALAALVQPRLVGLYATVVLWVTLYQAVIDQTARQLAPVALRSEAHVRLLRKYAYAAAAVAPIGVAAASVAAIGPGRILSEHPTTVAALVLSALAPVPAAFSIFPLARLQMAAQWRRINNVRAIATLVSLVVGLAVLATGAGLLGAGVQLLVAETLLTVLLARGASMGDAAATHEERAATEDRVHHSRILATAGYNVLAWARGQFDRFLALLIAGPTALALYTFGVSMARLPVDAALGGLLNVHRARLAGAPAELTTVNGRNLVRGLQLSSTIAVLNVFVLTPLAQHVLTEGWKPSVIAIPIFSLGLPFASVAWLLGGTLVHVGRTATASAIELAGAVLSIPVGALLVLGIAWAAAGFVLREFAVASLLMWANRSVVTARTVLMVAIAEAVVIVSAWLGLLML